jgi:glutathione-regulated potassium-efflux system ancillary protein KefG
MPRILILFAHPVLEKSRMQQVLLAAASGMPDVTVNDLYELYPQFEIDIDREQELLTRHDIIIWQHPFYWYSCPALLKQWIDLVLEHGWAYGRTGHALEGKKIFNVITSGANTEAYEPGGFNKYSVQEYLKPFERTAELCRTTYWPPFWVPGVHRMQQGEIESYGIRYYALLTALRKGSITEEDILRTPLLNDFVSFNQPTSL